MERQRGRSLGIALGLAAGLVLVLAPLSRATHSPGGGPPRDLAVGAGQIDFSGGVGLVLVPVAFSAMSGPGESPKGHVNFGSGTAEGEVLCLHVQGNRAVLFFTDPNAAGFGQGEIHFALVARDFGEKSATPDKVNVFGRTGFADDACALFSAEPSDPLRGNAVVHGRPPGGGACGSVPPVVTLVEATQTLTVLQQLPTEVAPVSDTLTVIQTPAEGPFAAPTRAGNTTHFPVPFYLNEGPSGPQNPITVRVMVTDAPGTPTVDHCPSFGYTAVGLLKPPGSGASASAVTPATGTTLSNPAEIIVSFAPDVGDVVTCIGTICTSTPGNYAPTFTLSAGPTSFLVSGPIIRAGGTSAFPNRNCGGNRPLASFTPPSGTSIAVNIPVVLNASGTSDADNAPLQLTDVGPGPASTGCGFMQQVRFNWDAESSPSAAPFEFTVFGIRTPPPVSSDSATAVHFTAKQQANYAVKLTAGDGTGLSSDEAQNVYTAQ